MSVIENMKEVGDLVKQIGDLELNRKTGISKKKCTISAVRICAWQLSCKRLNTA
jgi:hypothetical protein